jgi:trypsin
MAKFILLLALAISAASAAQVRELPSHNFRIVGGTPATPHEFPWTVDVRRGSHYCGGSVINANWIVTAAHCATVGANQYTIVAGDHNIAQNEGPEQTRQVTRIVRHPQYSGSTFANDIALMELSEPLTLNDQVKAATLPPQDWNPDFSGDAVVAGWGALSEGGSSPTTLYKVTVPLVTNAVCNSNYNPNGYQIDDTMICAGEGGKDSCQGDSGGPMMCGENLCGIVSWGIGCARPGYPGVYSRVAKNRDWLDQTIMS